MSRGTGRRGAATRVLDLARGRRGASDPGQHLAQMLTRTKRRFYCIAFVMRSGSTALCEDLAAMGVGDPTEYFQEPLYSTENVLPYLHRAVDSTGGPVFGFKASIFQVQVLCERLAATGFPVRDNDLRNLFLGLRFVLLVRRDTVRQAISGWRAHRSGVWHLATGDGGAPGRPDYDFESLRAMHAAVLDEEWAWRRYLERIGAAPLEVAYEDYLADREGTLRRICRHLRVRPSSPPPAAPRTRIMRDAWTDEIAARYAEDAALMPIGLTVADRELRGIPGAPLLRRV